MSQLTYDGPEDEIIGSRIHFCQKLQVLGISAMGDTLTPQIDHRHPLYLQPSDTPGALLIDIKLTCPENFGLWSRSMRFALLGKNKLSFVEGTCVKSLYKGELADLWEQCNVAVLLWIGRSVSQELLPSIVYASDASKVWTEFKERTYVNNTTVEGTNSVEGHFFTEVEYKQLVSLLNKSASSGDCKANMAGIVSLLSKTCGIEWIINSGASHHITSYKAELIDIRKLGNQEGRKVQVPNGNKSQITDIGDATILGGQRIRNVLHVPDFKFNLLSVAKLTKDLGLYSGKVMGIGREFDGLYILQEHTKSVVGAAIIRGKHDTKLWHSRLGHPSMKAMQHIPTLRNLEDE
ncbi:uncharacterized protein LOC107771759 [Nicotiana tabacum]|uniref:Uncharacterized protein LOC107771759 n=1 Tax=Nicotiana tabacum TaxID=4097 RepID=A0A1S3Y481_TOBAC|nr:PREDICTED: uncharacterized protein LOC107771759 [Nicotiana tabacum]